MHYIIGMKQHNIINILHKNAELRREASLVNLTAELEIGQQVSLAGLLMRATAIAHYLQQQGVQPQDRLVICHENPIDFIASFFGCLMVRAIAVPYQPPVSNSLCQTFVAITEQASPVAILTDSKVSRLFRYKGMLRFCLINQVIHPGQHSQSIYQHLHDHLRRSIRIINTDKIKTVRGSNFQAPSVKTSDIAFLQYTCGKGANPKGAIMTHEMLMAKLGQISQDFSLTTESRALSWLPLSEDLGLIGNVLNAIFTGYPLFLMSPENFHQEPGQWLRGIEKFEISHSGGSAHGYQLCNTIKDASLSKLDLSSWRLAYVGKEVVDYDTIKKFRQRFLRNSNSRCEMIFCYGNAECGGYLTSARQQRLFVKKNKSSKRYAICGASFERDQLIIVNPNTLEPSPAGSEGEIWINAKAVTDGYWNNSGATKTCFNATTADCNEVYFRSGDTGLLHQGKLIITGKVSDLVIVHGKYHHLNDIEKWCLQAHPDVSAALAFTTDNGNCPQLVIVLEVQAPCYDSMVVNHTRRALLEKEGLNPLEIIQVKPGALSTDPAPDRDAIKNDYTSNNLSRLR